MKSTQEIRSMPENATYDVINSPVGKLMIFASAAGLHAILWDSSLNDPAHKRKIFTIKRSKSNPIIIQTTQQLNEYFHGKRERFDLPLSFKGTAFQTQAWQQLLKIPYSETINYAMQAERLGNKNKARAVGLANRCNPISIVIPCHRVIGSNGNLVGFGGGIERKAYLLQLEKRAGR